MKKTSPQPDNVLKIGGAVCQRPGTVARLADAWMEHGGSGRWVLVHGGGPQLDQALRALGERVEKVAGLRVTSPRAAKRVQETLDRIGAGLAHGLTCHGVPAVHVPATEGLLQAVPKALPDGRALGRVGTATSFDARRLKKLVPSGHVAVVTPVGWDAAGPLNVNADEGALAVATSLEAAKLVLCTDVAAVRGSTGDDLPFLVPAEVELLLRSGTAQGGMVPKLEASLEALRTGVSEVRIGRLDCAWDGSGTRIYAAPEAEVMA